MYKFSVKQPNIHIFGAGGTGGYLVEALARLLAGHPKPAKITLYDGDLVEAKNLKRQNFGKDDIGCNKAEQLVAHLQDTILDCPTLCVEPNYVSDKDDLIATIWLSMEPDDDLILVSAVDNAETRLLINTVASDLGFPAIQLDSGCNELSGQVMLYTNAANPVTQFNTFGQPCGEVTLPSMLDQFPELASVTSNQDRNPAFVDTCEEHAESYPQSMLANRMLADIQTSIIAKLVSETPIHGNLWTLDLLTDTIRVTDTEVVNQQVTNLN